MTAPLGIFVVTAPGLESVLDDEARELGFEVTGSVPGGVEIAGSWRDVWRANLELRGAVRVLARIAEFRALHLAQLDKRARKLPWQDWLLTDIPVRVEAVCKKSRIYHAKAATQRVETALAASGFTLDPGADIVLKLRIFDDLATFSLDTSGISLHRRGLKEQVNKAPMRETLASLFLRSAGFTGKEPVLDPMCGSGTFVIEAAEIAAGLQPGRARIFAFEKFAPFSEGDFAALRKTASFEKRLCFTGSDRDQGAVAMAKANAERAGVTPLTDFVTRPISEAAPPDGPPGLVVVNPPYGGRVGKRGLLHGLYGAFGKVMRERFAGWRIALVTSDAGLAKAAALPWADPGPIVDHGGTKIRLWQAQL